MEENEVYYIKETWCDEYKTLMQCIMYLANSENNRDKFEARNLLNPNMTTLLRIEKLNKNMEKIDD